MAFYIYNRCGVIPAEWVEVHLISVVFAVNRLLINCFLSRGCQGLIAYGCHSLVLVVDPSTAQTLQVLEKHKANVVKVSWMDFYHNKGNLYIE